MNLSACVITPLLSPLPTLSLVPSLSLPLPLCLSDNASYTEPSAGGTHKCHEKRGPNMLAPTAATGVTVHRVARCVPLRPFHSGRNSQKSARFLDVQCGEDP